MTTHPPNIVTVLGNTPNTIDVVFCKVFKFNTSPGTILILDYTGRGAAALSDLNKMSLLKKNIHWFDLNDKRHTLQLLQINQSPHIRTIIERLLKLIINISKVSISNKTFQLLIDILIKFAKDGPVSLLTLLRILTVPELKNIYLGSDIRNEEIIIIQQILLYVLRFPSVYAICEGINRVPLENLFSNKTVIWLESFSEYAEKTEHHLINGITDIMIENSVKNFFCREPNSKLDFTIIHIYPPSNLFDKLPIWIQDSARGVASSFGNVRHVCIHNLQPNYIIRKITEEWINISENIWVVGKIGQLKRNLHKHWLTDIEMNMIEGLDWGKVWIRSNKTGKAIVASVKTNNETLSLSYKLRTSSNNDRKITSVLQMSSEIDNLNFKPTGVFGLYKKLCDKEFLRQGWSRVKEGNKDSHGIDKITIKDFASNIEQELNELEHELKSKQYKCRPLRRVYIEKPEGGSRGLGIACIRDRVVQTSCLVLLETFFESDFSNYSFAYRPRRNAHQAVSLFRSRIKTGFEWAVTADIKKCFDSIDHNVLLGYIERKISDTDILDLIKHFLYVEVLEFNELLPSISGVPQGESLSPLLANIYLDSLDKHLESLGYPFVRYADDIIIQAKTKEEAGRALSILENFLMEPLHLEIKPAKTNISSVEDGIEFLGFKVYKETIRIRIEKINNVFEVLEKNIKKLAIHSTLGEKIKSLTIINSTIRGFRNYFFLTEEDTIKTQLELLEGQIENITKSILTPEILNDPFWICRERFCTVAITGESYEEEAIRKAKVGQSYPLEKIHEENIMGFIKDNYDGKKSVIIEDNELKENESKQTIKSSVFETNKRLFVMTHGSYITNEEEYLVVKRKKNEIARYKLNDLGLVFLQGRGMNISVSLQLKLAELDIPIVFAPTIGIPVAATNSIRSLKSHLRRLQILRREDIDIIHTGISMLQAKIRNQASLLKYFFKYKKRNKEIKSIRIKKDIYSIQEIAERIKLLNPGTENVRALAMGYEGQAASIYWQIIKQLIPPEFDFMGRITKSARDIINQCFNYVYGLLYGEVWRAVIKAGIDPYFGIIHGSLRDTGSMVFDVIEEFRSPFADRIVIGMLGRGFRPELNTEGLLRTKSKKLLAKAFLKKWHNKIKWKSFNFAPVKILEHQIQSFSKLLKKEGKYFPYRMSW